MINLQITKEQATMLQLAVWARSEKIDELKTVLGYFRNSDMIDAYDLEQERLREFEAQLMLGVINEKNL